jgi:hypothetical protein
MWQNLIFKFKFLPLIKWLFFSLYF